MCPINYFKHHFTKSCSRLPSYPLRCERGFTGCGWAPYRRRNIALWLVSLFSKCNDKHVTQPGAGLSFPGTVCYLVEMGNLKHANLQNRRDLLFNFMIIILIWLLTWALQFIHLFDSLTTLLYLVSL